VPGGQFDLRTTVVAVAVATGPPIALLYAIDTVYVPSGSRCVEFDELAIVVVTALAHELVRIPDSGSKGSKVTFNDWRSVTEIERVAPPLSLVVSVIRMEPDNTVSGNDPVTVNPAGARSNCAPLIGANNVGVVVVGGIWCETFMTTPVLIPFSWERPVTRLVEFVSFAMS
jgi:hypothetical protein